MQNPVKILLVDDEPNIIIGLEFLLEQAGYRVTTAANGSEALQISAKEIPDLAILDVMMPEMDGFQLAEALRLIPELANLQIIFLTARGQPEDRTQGYRSGAEVYLTKPFDNQELLTIVEELITFG